MPRYRTDGFLVLLYKDVSLKEYALDTTALVSIVNLDKQYPESGYTIYSMGLKGGADPAFSLPEPYYSDSVPAIAVVLTHTPKCPRPVAVVELFWEEVEELP